jgi:hypothetical protein
MAPLEYLQFEEIFNPEEVEKALFSEELLMPLQFVPEFFKLSILPRYYYR